MKHSELLVEDFVIESILEIDADATREQIRSNTAYLEVGDNINIFYKNNYIISIDWSKLT